MGIKKLLQTNSKVRQMTKMLGDVNSEQDDIGSSGKALAVIRYLRYML